ncbi:TonB-dependent receptor domain-containing protein [Sphingomonas sp. MMS24-JH45]
MSGFASPFATDNVGFALGGEYRSYATQQLPDFFAEQGLLGGSGGPTTRFSGKYNVKEAYGEVIAPLVVDRPFFRSLTVEGGIRYSSYNIDAQGSPKFDTTTYKGGGSWEPVEGFKFRGNYQRAVRAPNITELFLPTSTGLTNLTSDPCAAGATVGNANLAAICLAQGAPANRVTSRTIPQPAAGQANITSGGNPNIRPETANTITAGILIEPRSFIPGLTISADYYNIKIRDAITSFTPGDIIRSCFGTVTAASATSAACQAIGRNPATGALSGPADTTFGLITQLTNNGVLLTDGVDLNVNYRRDLGFAGLDLSFIGNWTSRSIGQVASGLVRRDCVGFYSANCGSMPARIIGTSARP